MSAPNLSQISKTVSGTKPGFRTAHVSEQIGCQSSAASWARGRVVQLTAEAEQVTPLQQKVTPSSLRLSKSEFAAPFTKTFHQAEKNCYHECPLRPVRGGFFLLLLPKPAVTFFGAEPVAMRLTPADTTNRVLKPKATQPRAAYRSQAHSPISELSELKICLLAFAELVTKVRPRENAP